jgi:hypothetical protein
MFQSQRIFKPLPTIFRAKDGRCRKGPINAVALESRRTRRRAIATLTHASKRERWRRRKIEGVTGA